MLLLHVPAQRDTRYTGVSHSCPFEDDRLLRNRRTIYIFFYPAAAPEPGHDEIHYLAPDIQDQSGTGQTRGCSGSVELSWVSIMVSSGYGLGYGLRKGLVRLVMGTRVGVADLVASGLEAAASMVDVESPPAPFKWPGSRPAGWTCGSASCSC